MKKYILATFALIAMCISAMAETPSNAFQLNFKDATDSVVVMLKDEPSYEFSTDGTQMTVYKGTTALGTAHSVSNVASLMYVTMHQHTLTMVQDTVFPTDETTGTLAYWQCTGTEEDPGCMLYFADSLGIDTIGDATALAAWLAGEGMLPIAYNKEDRYVVVTTNDTMLVANTKYLSEVTNVTVEGNNSLLLIFREGTASIHAGDTIAIPEAGIDSILMKKGEELMPAATTGTAKRTGNVDVNWIQLWENGPKFAEYNVGAENNKAEDYGGYYCWGSSIDKDPAAAYKSGSDPLSGNDDTATNLWGSNWRMLTKAELDALLANCDVEWTVVNGVNGCKFTGKGDYASNSVFLPATGSCYSGGLSGQGNYGFYWPSTPFGSGDAFYLYFKSGRQSVGSDARGNGFSVRAVLVEE